MEAAFSEIDATKWSISDRLGHIKLRIEDAIARIKQQEPPEAGVKDIEKLRRALDSLTTDFEIFWSQTTTKVEEHRRTCTFAEDLERIDGELKNLNEHLKNVDARMGENLQTAKATSASFVQFEKTVTVRRRSFPIHKLFKNTCPFYFNLNIYEKFLCYAKHGKSSKNGK